MILKKFICAVLSLFMVLSPIASDADYTEAETKTVFVTYRGKTEPNAMVSFMIIKSSGSFSNLGADDIQNVEIVNADEDGNYSYSVVLKDAKLSSTGEIMNYKLNSNIKTLDINSGTISENLFVTIDGKTAAFSTPPLLDDNGVVFVPIEETFSKLKTELVYDAETKTYTGKGNNGDIEIVVGKDTAEVDWVDIEMPAASKNINGIDMIPAYILEDALKISAPVYDEQARTLILEMPRESEKQQDEFDIAEVVKTLPKGELFFSNSDFLYNLNKSVGAEYVSIEKNNDVLRLTTNKNNYGVFPNSLNGIEVSSYTSKDFNMGETGLISFDARALSTGDESGNATMRVMYQRDSDWNKALNEQISIRADSEWKTYYLPVYSGIYDMKADEWPRIVLQIGGKPMCIEMRNFSFVNYKTDVPISTLQPTIKKPYKGMEEDALWRKEAYRRIEKYRKNDINVRVVDKNGNPVPNAQIRADMDENEFMFGVSLCENELLNLDTSSKSGAIYDSLITNDFNAGVCGLEMKAEYTREDDGAKGIEMANEFLRRGKRFRGHTIFWDGLFDTLNYDELSYDELYDQVLKRARNMAYAFKGKVDQWDVLNESCSSTYMHTKFNSTKIYSDIFKEVHRVDSDAKLFVNETGIEGLAEKGQADNIPGLLSIIEELKNDGAPIDGIGIQAHCVNYLYPQGFYHQLDNCASAVDEIAITEYDFKNENMDYAAEHLRDTLLATFSHPKATAFVIWGVQDAMHWRNCAPFYDSDWNAKQETLDMWENMVNSEFETHENVKTNGEGKAVIRGFRGDYTVKCSVDGATCSVPFKLTKNGTNEVTFVVSGSQISAQASNAPSGKVSPIEYKDIVDAQKAYEKENAAHYKKVYFDNSFKGKNGIENNDVLYGTKSDSEDYLSGTAWASTEGIFDIAGTSSREGVLLKNAVKTADLRHRVSLANRAKNTDVVAEFTFSTLNAAENGEFSVDLELLGNGTYKCGSLIYSNGEYAFETIDKAKFALEKNERYTIRAAFVYKNGEYELDCSIYDKTGEVVFARDSSGEVQPDVSDINTVNMEISANGNSDEDVFEIYAIRVSGEKDGEIVEYEETQTSETVLSDNMRDFTLSNAVYMGKTPKITAASDIPDGKWGLYSSSEQTNAFKYNNKGHYLYARRAEPNGENILARSFAPASEGSELTLSYNMYINCSAKWYNSYGKAALMLGSEDMSTCAKVSLFEYDQYNAFYISIFGEKNGIVNSTTSDWNWVDLDVNVRFSPNTNGAYNAYICITNDFGFRYEKIIENILTADDFKKLNTVYIVSETTAGNDSDNRYDVDVCGFKNINVSRTTAPLTKNENGETVYGNNAANFEIGYNNITGRLKELVLIKALYENENLIETKIVPFTLAEGKNKMIFGAGENSDADEIKVFLLNDMKTLVPLKEADTIKIRKESE